MKTQTMVIGDFACVGLHDGDGGAIADAYTFSRVYEFWPAPEGKAQRWYPCPLCGTMRAAKFERLALSPAAWFALQLSKRIDLLEETETTTTRAARALAARVEALEATSHAPLTGAALADEVNAELRRINGGFERHAARLGALEMAGALPLTDALLKVRSSVDAKLLALERAAVLLAQGILAHEYSKDLCRGGVEDALQALANDADLERAVAIVEEPK